MKLDLASPTMAFLSCCLKSYFLKSGCAKSGYLKSCRRTSLFEVGDVMMFLLLLTVVPMRFLRG